MKKLSTIAVVVVLAVVTIVYFLTLETAPPERDRRTGSSRDQVLELFDADKDELISTTEMENAIEVLKSRDRNGDGFLSRNELPRPPRRGDRRLSDHRGRDRSGLNRPDPSRPGADRPGPSRPGPSRPDADRPEEDSGSMQSIAASMRSGTVSFDGGHETVDGDGGRPVVLIAAALGVEPEVFRKVFGSVRPANGASPSPMRALVNKKALMDALGPYGVTNERLDEVTDFYRYRPEHGELWAHAPASATATIENGELVELKITNPGAGYSTAPRVTVEGHPDLDIKATIAFGTDLKTNGRVSSLTLVTE